MKKLFCRIGSKARLAKLLNSMIPTHRTYIEPFCGGAALYWFKEASEREVLNDLDKILMDGYKAVKKARLDPKRLIYYDSLTSEELTRFYQSAGGSWLDKLAKSIIRFCFTFSSKGVGKVYKKEKGHGQVSTKLKNLVKYQERMENTILLCQDYKTVIKKYDSADTFIYLDPPYESSGNLYNDSEINYHEMENILSKIRGKFILSINDSPNIRDIFKQFRIKKIIVKPSSNSNIGKKQRNELLIYNF